MLTTPATTRTFKMWIDVIVFINTGRDRHEETPQKHNANIHDAVYRCQDHLKFYCAIYKNDLFFFHTENIYHEASNTEMTLFSTPERVFLREFLVRYRFKNTR